MAHRRITAAEEVFAFMTVPTVERPQRMNGPMLDRPSEMASELVLATVSTAAACARRFVADQLRKWQIEGLADTCTLLVSELVTNAIKAVGVTTSPLRYRELRSRRIGIIRMRLTLRGHAVLVEVWDEDPTPPELLDADPEDDSGRCLQLVSLLSRSWGYYPSGAGGKVVWCVTDSRTY